jgi:recombination protein RecT
MTATTVSQAVATRETGIVSVMWQRKTHFAAILPDHIEVKGFLGTAAAALYGNADLMRAAETSPDTLITALMRCAALGHQPGTDEFYLTPRKKKGVPQVLGIEGYRGIVERMYRSGAVASVVVREVCAKDKFRYVEGLDDKPVHGIGGTNHTGADATGADFFGASGTRDRGEMVGVYAYAQLTTGAVSRVVILNRDDVLAARDAGGYRADDPYSPWNRLDAGKDHPEFTGRSMWWKTAARRLEPWVPTSAEFRREQLRAAVQAAGPAAAPPASMPDTEIHEAVIVEDTPPASNGQQDRPAHQQRRRGRAAPRDASPAGEPHTPDAADPPTPPADPAGEAQDPGPAPDETPGSGPAGPGPRATTGQVGIIQSHWKRLGYDDRDPDSKAERLAFTARAAGLEDLVTTSDLTQEQAAQVRTLLEQCKDRAGVIERLYAGTPEGGSDG